MKTETTTTGDITQEGTTHVSNNWKNNVPEAVREWDEFKNSETQEQFFDQMANHRKHLGQSIRIPSEEAGSDTWDQFHEKILNKVPNLMMKPEADNPEALNMVYRQLGFPESPDQYRHPELQEGQKLPEQRLAQLREFAHANKMTQDQFMALQNQAIGEYNENLQSADDAYKQQRHILHKEWGEAYDQRTEQVKRVAEASGAPKSLLEAIDSGQVDADTMLWLHGMAKNRGEGTPMQGVEESIPTPQDIQGKIDDIMNNKDHPYWIGSHPRHKQAVDQMLDLRRKLA